MDSVIIDATTPKVVQDRVPHGSVVGCLTRNPGVLGSSRT